MDRGRSSSPAGEDGGDHPDGGGGPSPISSSASPQSPQSPSSEVAGSPRGNRTLTDLFEESGFLIKRKKKNKLRPYPSPPSLMAGLQPTSPIPEENDEELASPQESCNPSRRGSFRGLETAEAMSTRKGSGSSGRGSGGSIENEVTEKDVVGMAGGSSDLAMGGLLPGTAAQIILSGGATSSRRTSRRVEEEEEGEWYNINDPKAERRAKKVQRKAERAERKAERAGKKRRKMSAGENDRSTNKDEDGRISPTGGQPPPLTTAKMIVGTVHDKHPLAVAGEIPTLSKGISSSRRSSSSSRFDQVTHEQLASMILEKKDELLVVDVRGKDFCGGNIPGGINIRTRHIQDNPGLLVKRAINGRVKYVVFTCMYSVLRAITCSVALTQWMAENPDAVREIIETEQAAVASML